MAVSSSKMLQIARETDGTGNPKKIIKTEKGNSQNHSGEISIHYWFGLAQWHQHIEFGCKKRRCQDSCS
jgi:hypothetical protein